MLNAEHIQPFLQYNMISKSILTVLSVIIEDSGYLSTACVRDRSVAAKIVGKMWVRRSNVR